MIKNFSEFINEVYQEFSTDSDEMARNKMSINDLEKYIREFQSKKTILHNIYMRYKTEDELMSKLKSGKFIANYEVDSKNPQRVKATNIKDSRRMKFLNPLLAEVARVSEKRREIINLEKDITKQEETIKDRQSAIQQDPQLKDSFTEDIKNTEGKIDNIQKRIDEIKAEISVIENQTKIKFQQMRKDFQLKSKILAKDLQDRKQTQLV